MKTILAILAALSLTACASTASAPAQMYRAKGHDAQAAISGTLTQSSGLFSTENTVSILIDGQRVAGGTFTGGSAEFAGQWKDAPVLADCSAVAAGNISYQLMYGTDRIDVKCTVMVSGERAASFVMVP